MEILTKKCKSGRVHCNKEKLTTEFYEGRNQCKKCVHKQKKEPK